ncbi:heparinase II/III domain-containing protein [Nocardiopsis algeriensis]|uniref:heparinase II/III domain-containing protein n=1 Tax=Nocardiopsis algeriensis TaxID=1478215 RepID=UPI001FEAD481|nr:heparinase II/III family protein [Nocardiopsis algeriensis]
MSPEEIRSALASSPTHPYETLFPDDHWGHRTQAAANKTISGVWKLRNFPEINVNPPVDWEKAASPNRAWNFHFHSWDFLSCVLAAHDRTGEPRYLSWAVQVVCDWARCHPQVAPGMAWYDTAIGLRGYRLGYVVERAARSEHVGDADLTLLLRCAELHLEALSDDRFFAPHSNHGFYVAAGQLALTRRLRGLPGLGMHRRQARERVRQLVRTQFTPGGIHREHSPGYHLVAAATFQKLLDTGLVGEEEFRPMLDRIQEALAWFVLPNGRLAMFGDTSHVSVLREEQPHIADPALTFAVTGGTRGKAPNDRWRSFPEAGYFIARDRWPKGPEDYADCSYLAQTAAFHSRTHKHADDLSMVWYDRGHEILVDAGKFGYLDQTTPDSDLGRAGFPYAHPSRVYVESTRAHNTVEIDGASYQRRGVTPYGSGIRRAGEHRGILYCGTHVRHNRTIRHARTLALLPGEWLLVHDWLWDTAERPHTYTQRFHFAPELDLSPVGDRFAADLPDTSRLHVVPLLPATALPPVKGQREPDLLGWISRRDGELRPCWTSAYQIAGEPSCSISTLMAFGRKAPEPGLSTVDKQGERVCLRWAHEGEDWTLSFGRPDRKDFYFHMEREAVPYEPTPLQRVVDWMRERLPVLPGDGLAEESRRESTAGRLYSRR